MSDKLLVSFLGHPCKHACHDRADVCLPCLADRIEELRRTRHSLRQAIVALETGCAVSGLDMKEWKACAKDPAQAE